MFQYVVVLAIVIFVVTLVGHGIWVLIAALLRPLLDAGQRLPTCPRCLVPLSSAGVCTRCGWPARSTSPVTALAELLQRVEQLRQAGMLDPAAARRLHTALLSEQHELQAKSQGAARPAVAPASAPAVAPSAAADVAEVFAEAEIVEDAPPAPLSVPLEIPLAGGAQAASSAVESPVARPTEGQAPSTTGSTTERPPVAPRSPEERVREFAARQQFEAVEVRPRPAPAPRRSMADLLSAFMEEKNIRWGELIGGLLIVCCSIALVISFWAEISERPLLKFVALNGVTAGLFGIGFYMHARWKLRATSEGVLAIATLLVPLNFLAIAAMSRAADGISIVTLVGEVISVSVFAFLVRTAGKVITPGHDLRLAAGVIVPSVAELLIRRWIGPDSSTARLLQLAALPVGCYVVVNLWSVAKVHAKRRLGRLGAAVLLTFLGMTSFAVLLPLALLIVKTENAAEGLHRLAPMIVCCAAPSLAVGGVLWKRLKGASVSEWRTAGTSVGVFGAALLLGALVLAWPTPSSIVLIATLNFAMLTTVGIVLRLPGAHLPALVCLSIAYLVAARVLAADIPWQGDQQPQLVASLLSAATGTVLALLAFVLAGFAAAWARRGYRGEALAYVSIAAAVAIVSLATVTWYGFRVPGDPNGATWVYLAFAAATLVAAAYVPLPAVALAGSALTLAALWQGLAYRFAESWQLAHPRTDALLAHAAIVVLLAVVFQRLGSARREARDALAATALATSGIALALIAESALRQAGDLLWVRALVASAVWLTASVIYRRAELFAGFQWVLTGAIVLYVGEQIREQAWYIASPHPWLDPRTPQAHGMALAVLSLAWTGLRVFVARFWPPPAEAGPAEPARAAPWGEQARSLLNVLLNPAWPAVDRIVFRAVAVILAVLVLYAAMPGVAQELKPQDAAVVSAPAEDGTESVVVKRVRVVPPIDSLEIAGIPHAPAAERPTWILLGLVLATSLLSFWERLTPARLLGALAIAWLACPLAAALWEADVAVASALRWATAIFFLLASAGVWASDHLARVAAAAHLDIAELVRSGSRKHARNLLLVLLIAPLCVMAGSVAVRAVPLSPLDPAISQWLTWIVALFVVSTMALVAARTRYYVFGSAAQKEAATDWMGSVANLVFLIGSAPLIIVLLYMVTSALRTHPLVGPEPDSFFFRIGLVPSYVVPLLIIAVGLIGHALRDEDSRFAFAAGLLFNVSATAAFLMAISKLGLTLDGEQWIRVAQLNAAVSAVYGLLWLGFLKIGAWAIPWSPLQRATLRQIAVGRSPGMRDPLKPDLLLTTQINLAPAIALVIIVPAVVWIFNNPVLAPPIVKYAGDGWAWLAVALGMAAVVAYSRASNQRLGAQLIGVLLTAVAFLTALSACNWDSGAWEAYHTLTVSLIAAAVLTLASDWVVRRFVREPQEAPLSDPSALPRPGIAWPVAMTCAVAILGLRGVPSDPGRPWWPIFTLVAASLLCVGTAALSARRGLLYASGLLWNIAVSVWFSHIAVPRWGIAEFVLVNIAALALPVVLWLIVDLMLIRPALPAAALRMSLPFHRFAAWTTTLAMLLVSVAMVVDRLSGASLAVDGRVLSAALCAVALACASCLWDAEDRGNVARVYLFGLAAVGLSAVRFDIAPDLLLWTITMMLAAYAVLTSYLWSRRAGVLQLASQLKIPVTADAESAGIAWLLPANVLLVALVLVLVYWVEMTFVDIRLRLVAAQGAIAQALAVGLLARGQRRSLLQMTALSIGVVGAVAFGWAWLPPDSPGLVLHRAVVLTVAVAAMTVLYGLGLAKFFPRRTEWTRAAQRLVIPLVAVGTASIAFVLCAEVWYTVEQGSVPMRWLSILAIAVALVVLFAACLIAALVPGRDPFGLSERGRTVYVYAAEAMLALMFMHIRLTMPWLFQGYFAQFWPLIVMLIAFVGVGLAEAFRRQRRTVLSEPLERTGALLPLLPVLAYWAIPNQVHYSLVLVAAGALYAALSVLRKSFAFGLLATLAANGGLWVFLREHDGVGLLDHPQLWLIPPALCVLVAAYLNREQINETQMAGIRYATSIVVYVSSTIDIFLNGVAQDPWLPVVLAAFSIVGVLAGIVMRVRAFLFLGTAFLVVALFTIIWYAAVDRSQTWIWWASGIVTGILIIALFAFFEQRRETVLRLVDQLKEWDA